MYAVGAFIIFAYLTWELVRYDETHPRNKNQFPQRYAPGFEDE